MIQTNFGDSFTDFSKKIGIFQIVLLIFKIKKMESLKNDNKTKNKNKNRV